MRDFSSIGKNENFGLNLIMRNFGCPHY